VISLAEVKWIKITVSMFDDEKIRLIESMPDKDAILIIWIKLLTLAGKTNASGYLYLSQNIPYTDEMLSTIFNRPLNTIRMALDTFKRFGMIEIDDCQAIHITNWEKHQNVEGMDRIREQNRIRKQRQRESQKQLEPSHVISRDSHATDVEVDKEVDKEKDVVVTPEKFYNQNFGLITKYIADDINNFICDGFEEQLIIRLMKEALKNNANNWNYVSKALSNLMLINIKTVEQYEAHEAERTRKNKKVVGLSDYTDIKM
jgi:predicted phage replisome organizer